MLSHARQLFRDSSVASVSATTPYCVKQIAQCIDFENAKVIIEYGPGDGAVTEILLQRMNPSCRLFAIETNDYFVSKLEEQFKDRRLTVIQDSAVEITRIAHNININRADCIVSGIPCSFLTRVITEKLVCDSVNLLHDQGNLIVYQSLTAVATRHSLHRILARHFEEIKFQPLLLNIPPLYLLDARQKSDKVFCDA